MTLGTDDKHMPASAIEKARICRGRERLCSTVVRTDKFRDLILTNKLLITALQGMLSDQFWCPAVGSGKLYGRHGNLLACAKPSRWRRDRPDYKNTAISFPKKQWLDNSRWVCMQSCFVTLQVQISIAALHSQIKKILFTNSFITSEKNY